MSADDMVFAMHRAMSVASTAQKPENIHLFTFEWRSVRVDRKQFGED